MKHCNLRKFTLARVCWCPNFFVKQPNGKVRIVVDYRGLNAIIIDDKYPLPLMTTLIEQVCTSQIFSKLDLKLVFNLPRIAEGD